MHPIFLHTIRLIAGMVLLGASQASAASITYDVTPHHHRVPRPG